MNANQHILLVEDSEDDIFMMQQARKRAGLQTSMHIAEDGRRAIAYLSGENEFGDRTKYPLPGVVLLDLKLPHITGHEVLEWIRKKSPVPTILVVILTSSNDASDIESAYRAGANSYLIKPTLMDELRDLMKLISDYWLSKNEPPPARV